MTRDDGRGPRPVRLKPKEIHPPRKGCRGALRRTEGGEVACFGSCLAPACLSSSGTSFQTRLCTTRPYINMSSSCRNRADRGEPSPLFLLFAPSPSCSSKARKSNVPSSSDPETWRPPVKTCLSKVSSRADSAGLFFVGVSFAHAGYREQFVTEIRVGPFYRRNNYFKALRAPTRRRCPFLRRPVNSSATSLSFLNTSNVAILASTIIRLCYEIIIMTAKLMYKFQKIK